MCDCDFSKSATTPLPLHSRLINSSSELLQNDELYHSLVGRLNYLTSTRPDLDFAVQTLSQLLHQPQTGHLEALHHTLRYIHHSSDQGILLKATDSLTVQAFSDSDWATCPDTRRSIT